MQDRQDISKILSVGVETLDDEVSNGDADPYSQPGRRNYAPTTIALPIDIIGLIFRECLRGETIHLPICYSCSTVTMPWVLGQVCSAWKHIVQNDPILWSSLTLSYEGVHDKEAFTRQVKDVIFPRIKLKPISLTCISGHEDDNTDAGEALYTLVIPHMARFRHLSLTMAYVALRPLMRSSPFSSTSLESLEIDFVPYASHHSQGVFGLCITSFENAPNLREVSVRDRYQGRVLGGYPLMLPWGQLRKLIVTLSISYSAVARFLPCCIQLVECTLCVNGYPWPGEEAPKIIIPQLRSLALTMSLPQVRERLLGSLVLPALKSLTLNLRLNDNMSVQEILHQLIVRSGCLLESFTVVSPNAKILDDDISTLLEAMPQLRKLVVPDTVSLPIPVMERMIMGELVPHLEAMHCAVESLPMALDLLEIRRSGTSPGALAHYGGIRCALFGTPGMMECKCDV